MGLCVVVTCTRPCLPHLTGYVLLGKSEEELQAFAAKYNQVRVWLSQKYN